MLKPGDRVEITKGPHNGSPIGLQGTIIREGFGAFWIKFDDGSEKTWRKAWLKKAEEKNDQSK